VGEPGIDGFEYTTVDAGPTSYRPGVAGDGAPVLLLHGFPQTHYCWHLVAPGLTGGNTVVVCDLKGYGESRSATSGGPLGEGYSNRERAGELVELMARLGFERFAVVGHDRGGRVAYRMALDHPESVQRLGVLNIVPTVDQFERMTADALLDYYPWVLLAQPPPFGERLVNGGAEYFLRHSLESWAAGPGAISPQATERYPRLHARCRGGRRRRRTGPAADERADAYSISPWRIPMATACVRVEASSFARMRLV
jgi:haloacetate dehalogenase